MFKSFLKQFHVNLAFGKANSKENFLANVNGMKIK